MPPLLGLVLGEQCRGTPASHPAAVIRGAVVIGAPLLAADLEDAVVGTAVRFDALCCRVEGALVKGHAEPWAEAEGRQAVLHLPSMGMVAARNERLWGDRGLKLTVGEAVAPIAIQPLFLEQVSQLTPAEHLGFGDRGQQGQQQQQGTPHSYRAAGPRVLGSPGGKVKTSHKQAVKHS